MKKNKITYISVFIFGAVFLHSGKSFARDWTSYSSENFNIYSDLSSKKATKLLGEFEIFRSLVFRTLGLTPQPSNSKMKIFVYDSYGEYRDIAPKNSAGFFVSTSNGPLMVISYKSVGIGGAQVLYHEYIHYVLNEHSTLIYPRWYNEGLAEVLGTTKVKDTKATLGGVSDSREDTIKYYPSFKVRELLSPNPEHMKEGIYQSRFYAYAWLLTHYLQISSFRDNPHLKDQTQEFLKRYSEGEDVYQAFETSFGMTPENMDLKLSHYIRKNRYTELNYEFNDFKIDVKSEELSKSQQQFQLADVASRVGKEDVALGYLQNLDNSSPDSAEAIALLAVLENHRGNIDVAKKQAETALKMGGDNGVVMTNYAHWVHDVRVRAKKNNEDTKELISTQIEFSNRALALDPDNLEALSFLWQAQLAAGEDVEALRTMTRAYQIDPSNRNVNYVIANHLIALKNGKLAIPFLERVINQTHSIESRSKIQELIKSIESKSEEGV